jgi:phosphate:Na+ symporter
MEQMLESLHKVMHGEPRQEKELRRMADDINVLYTAIKLYLARMPKDELAEEESRRWAEIIEMSLNLEQAPISSSEWAARSPINRWRRGAPSRWKG